LQPIYKYFCFELTVTWRVTVGEEVLGNEQTHVETVNVLFLLPW